VSQSVENKEIKINVCYHWEVIKGYELMEIVSSIDNSCRVVNSFVDCFIENSAQKE